MASAPISSSSRAVFWVIPTPPAEFSPFTTTKSGWCASRIPGKSEASVRRPMPPTTSPTKRSFTASDSANLRAVETATVTAGAGELVAVIGPNGAGKTTLLSILAGIQQPDAGELTVMPKGVGWVPQQAALYGKLTVEENLFLFARLERCANPRATVDRMLELSDLRERARDQVSTLSGG